MIDFHMSVHENFASFADSETGEVVFVESMDNREFFVRMGTLDASRPIGRVIASSNAQLNKDLAALAKKARAA